MANTKHLEILKKGVEVWNEWRKEYPDIRPDLSEADLRGVNLIKANLNYADLRLADLRGADLHGANFPGADLHGANLSEANLQEGYLRGADLTGAYLNETILHWANLYEVNLRDAKLIKAKLSGANLRHAHLENADLRGANLNRADIRGAHFKNANLSQTTLGDVILNIGDLEKSSLNLNQLLEIGLFDSATDTNIIIRSIEFEPKYKDAGVSILNYFSTILNQKYPDIQVKFSIEQEGLNVKMIIETPEGKREEIEQTLQEYGKVLSGQMAPEKFIKDDLMVHDLKIQLETAKLQIESEKRLSQIAKKHYGERIGSLEKEVKDLHRLIGETLSTSKSNLEVFKEFASDALKYLDGKNETIDKILLVLMIKIEQGLKESDEKEVKEMFITIRKENPEFFKKFSEWIIKGSVAGVAGNYLFEWMKSIM